MTRIEPSIRPLGDRALLLSFGAELDAATSARVLATWRCLADARLPGVTDLVPAYTSLAVCYDWQALPSLAQEQPWAWLADEVGRVLADAASRLADTVDRATTTTRQVEIPVCYEASLGPDLDSAAKALGLEPAELIRRHHERDYTVAFIGFRPGFPYLLGLDPTLALPRRPSPRARIEGGSVGIGGGQTGIYPAAGPGGWHLIGRTPLTIFDPALDPPALLAPGDRLRFVPIAASDFVALDAQASRPGAQRPAESTNAAFEVLHPGIHSSIQDPGRPGWRHLGVGPGGAADPIAARLVNALVGNPAAAPALELTLRGPDLRTLRPVTIALAGSGMEAQVDGRTLPFGRPIRLAAGQHLRFQATGLGARTWLAVAGGLAAPRWLDSAAVDVGSGCFGVPLAAGDRLDLEQALDEPGHTGQTDPIQLAPWWVDARAQIDAPMILRYVLDDETEVAWQQELPARVWRVGLAADRTGLRLEGTPLTAAAHPLRPSSAVLPGTVQVPADGQPILLGPDCQTTGGYPVAGHIIEADLPRLAQLKPGDLVWLQPTGLAEAQQARAIQSALVARMHLAIHWRHA